LITYGNGKTLTNKFWEDGTMKDNCMDVVALSIDFVICLDLSNLLPLKHFIQIPALTHFEVLMT
jgi:hypothetical protein